MFHVRVQNKIPDKMYEFFVTVLIIVGLRDTRKSRIIALYSELDTRDMPNNRLMKKVGRQRFEDRYTKLLVDSCILLLAVVSYSNT